MKSIPSFSADFSSLIEDKQADMESSQNGSIKVAGEKFELALGDNTVLSDGNSVWSYNKNSNEVMIDNLDEMFEDGISPTKMYTIWEEGFKHSYAGTDKIGEIATDKIKLFPIDPADKNYHTIVLDIKAGDPEVMRVKILGKEGVNMTYSISNFNKENFPGSQFYFEKSKYPGVESIDNR